MSDKEGENSGVVEPGYLKRFQQYFEKNLEKKVAIFTHLGPDPDGIGAMMGMSWLLDKAYGIQSDLFCSGSISHPQNMAMVNLLDPVLRSAEEYKAEDYALNVLVDTVPSHAGVGTHTVKFDIIVDHHKDLANSSEGLIVNLNAGSACGTVYDIIKNLKLKFSDDNDNDSRVATAMMVGITTDTDHMMSEETTQYEFDAWSELFEYRNTASLKKIVNYERPQLWVTAEADAVRRVVISDAIAVVSMGILPSKHRDLLADMASKLVCWEGVHTGVAFAIVDGDRVEGSVRSTNASVMVPALCKKLGTAFGVEYGDGGGKRGKGAYRYTLAGGSIEEDDDEETRHRVCELLSEKETKRIFRIMAK